MLNSDLPEKCLKLRKYFGYSQENIAHELGISPEAYGKIERGKTCINVERLCQLARVFSLAPWELLQFSADELLLLLINRRNFAPPPPARLNASEIDPM
jgi:transcriptional regulator with XRE-family HTH domain